MAPPRLPLSPRRSLVACAAVVLVHIARADGPATWAFEPPRDTFSPDALLDLTSLNEKIAGQSGFVRVGGDADFVLGDGRPARFWCVNLSIDHTQPFVPRPLWPQQGAPDLDHAARFLAKRGVNLVRLGFGLPADVVAHPGAAIGEINPQERDWYWKVVATMKQHGIYTILAPYWPAATKLGKTWGYGADAADANASGYLFFDDRLQAAYRGWMRQLLRETNPYTGLPLADDPAVAMIQLQNEDSLFFWTIDGIKGPARAELEAKFARWATAKYGSLDAARQAWGGDRNPADQEDAGRLGLFITWVLIQPRGHDGHAQRLADQTQFLGETMLKANGDLIHYLRQDLGCKQLINAGNWRPADPLHFYDAERWSCTPGDFLAVNRYVDAHHQGPYAGWAITNGDTYTNPSVLLDPGKLPVAVKQVEGKPFFVTESSWEMPLRHSTEGPFLISAYESLTGVDAFGWFTMTADEWTPPESANGYLPSQMKWSIADPNLLGTFPAAALIFRRQYLQRGAPAVDEHRDRADLWARKEPLIAEEGSFDPNRDAGSTTPTQTPERAISPLAFLVGPVEVAYGGASRPSAVTDLSKYIDAARKTVTSDTGEIALDYGEGYCTLHAPKAQGVAAFFKNHPDFNLGDISIHSGNDYGTVTAVSLDDLPLATSENILLQVGTECRPTGWKESPTTVQVDGAPVSAARIDAFGRAPWQVISPQVTVTIRNSACHSATALDMNGVARAQVPVMVYAQGLQLSFPDKTMYVVLRP